VYSKYKHVDMTVHGNITAITRRLHVLHEPYLYKPFFLHRHNNLESALLMLHVANRYEVDRSASEVIGVKNGTNISQFSTPSLIKY